MHSNEDAGQPLTSFEPDDVFLRMLLHDNEHMGQSIVYAGMNGIVPPWSR